MFYKCPKCKKVWQYPVGRCPECFWELARMKSEKIRVIGVSRVTIPTMFHPKVPYFVLLLENEKGNQWIQKSVNEYKIGDEFKIESSKDKNLPRTELALVRGAVAVWRLKYDILEGIEKVVSFLENCTGPTRVFSLGGSSKILILPTLVSPRHPYFAENTSPQFLESLIKYLTAKGAKLENIKVAGQSFDEIPIEASVQKSQLLKVCQDYKIMPLDLAKTNFVKKTQDNFTFEISEEVFNSDLVINLPILKMGKIAAIENILKFLKKENYLALKYLYSGEEIIENLNKVLFTPHQNFGGGPQYLTLAEAQSIQKPDQFISHLNLILASFNSLNLDRVFAEITMIKELPECLKKVKIENIPIVGRKVEELQYEVEKY